MQTEAKMQFLKTEVFGIPFGQIKATGVWDKKKNVNPYDLVRTNNGTKKTLIVCHQGKQSATLWQGLMLASAPPTGH